MYQFLSLIDPEGGPDACWPFLGSIMGAGYGQLPCKTPIGRLAHRYAYVYFFGSIPKGKVVMHTCDFRLCCNPRHLKLGTQQENLQDMNCKKRHGKHPLKCTPEQLQQILHMKKQKVSVAHIAKQMGFHKRTIFSLIAKAKKQEDWLCHLD